MNGCERRRRAGSSEHMTSASCPLYPQKRTSDEGRSFFGLTTRLTLRAHDAPRDAGHEGDDQDEPDDHVKLSISAVAPRVHKPLMCKAPHNLSSRCKPSPLNHSTRLRARGGRKHCVCRCGPVSITCFAGINRESVSVGDLTAFLQCRRFKKVAIPPASDWCIALPPVRFECDKPAVRIASAQEQFRPQLGKFPRRIASSS
jgi:hypothetical protein